jgi:hypothetical protein
VAATKAKPTPQRLTLFSDVSFHQKGLAHFSTKGFLKAEPTFTSLGHASTTELEAPKNNTMLSNNK